MELYTPGQLVRSLAGHDKGSLMVILEVTEDGQCLYLADGDRRPVTSPKRKNRKHVQPICRSLDGTGPWTNEQIKKAIKVYTKEDLNV